MQDASSIKKVKTHNENDPNMIQIREQIAKRFDNTDKSNRITDSTTSELSTYMPPDKLMAMKAKRIARKREQITVSGNDEDLIESSVNKQLGDALEEDLIKEVLSRERVWRNRKTILESNGKRFDTNIFAILQSIKTKEEILTSQNSSSQQTSMPLNKTDISLSSDMTSMHSMTTSLQPNQSQQKPRPLNYSRFDQERYGPKDDTGGFSIDTKRSYQFNTISLNEQQTTVKSTAAPTPQRQQLAQKSSIPLSLANNSVSSSQKRSVMRPIIVVPASRTSIITLYNAIDILQDLK